MEKQLKMAKVPGDKNIVFVFGAGASQHLGCPLDQDFWKEAERNGLISVQKNVSNVLTKMFPGWKTTLGMEEFFTYVDSMLSIGKLNSANKFNHLGERDDFGRFEALLAPFFININDNMPRIQYNVSTLGKIVEMIPYAHPNSKLLRLFENMNFELLQIIAELYRGLTKETGINAYRDLMKKLLPTNQSTFITFNYDTFLDRALKKKGFTYYLWFHEIRHENDAGSFLFREIDDFKKEKNEGKIELLKLHGSVNWFAAFSKDDTFFTDPLHVFKGALDGKNELDFAKLHNLEFRKLKNPKSVRPHPKDGEVIFRRAIVPPIVNKIKKFWDTVGIERLWMRAAYKLLQANKIIFIGYSLPPADFLAQWLFRTTLNNKAKVMVVAKSCENRERFNALYGKRLVKYLPAPFEHNVKEIIKFVK